MKENYFFMVKKGRGGDGDDQNKYYVYTVHTYQDTGFPILIARSISKSYHNSSPASVKTMCKIGNSLSMHVYLRTGAYSGFYSGG